MVYGDLFKTRVVAPITISCEKSSFRIMNYPLVNSYSYGKLENQDFTTEIIYKWPMSVAMLVSYIYWRVYQISEPRRQMLVVDSINQLLVRTIWVIVQCTTIIQASCCLMIPKISKVFCHFSGCLTARNLYQSNLQICHRRWPGDSGRAKSPSATIALMALLVNDRRIERLRCGLKRELWPKKGPLKMAFFCMVQPSKK